MRLGYTETVCACKSHYTIAAVPPVFRFGDNMPMGNVSTIAELRRRLGLTQGQLAERLNVEQPTVQRWETGTREPNMSKLAEIADALGVEPGELFRMGVVPAGPRLLVKGEVAAGVWVEAYEWPEDDWRAFTGRNDVAADLQHRFGLRVVGDSMNEIYPDGTIVECVSVFGHAEISPGRRVVVVRKSIRGMIEATVKELVADAEGRLWAVPRSTNPQFQAFSLDQPDEGIVEVRIAAVVVGSYRPE